MSRAPSHQHIFIMANETVMMNKFCKLKLNLNFNVKRYVNNIISHFGLDQEETRVKALKESSSTRRKQGKHQKVQALAQHEKAAYNKNYKGMEINQLVLDNAVLPSSVGSYEAIVLIKLFSYSVGWLVMKVQSIMTKVSKGTKIVGGKRKNGNNNLQAQVKTIDLLKEKQKEEEHLQKNQSCHLVAIREARILTVSPPGSKK